MRIRIFISSYFILMLAAFSVIGKHFMVRAAPLNAYSPPTQVAVYMYELAPEGYQLGFPPVWERREGLGINLWWTGIGWSTFSLARRDSFVWDNASYPRGDRELNNFQTYLHMSF